MLKSTFLRVRWIGYEFLAMDKIFSWLKSHFPPISHANIYFFSLGKRFLSGQKMFCPGSCTGQKTQYSQQKSNEHQKDMEKNITVLN